MARARSRTRERSRGKSAAKTPAPRDLRYRNRRPASDRVLSSRPYADPILAPHSLESALTGHPHSAADGNESPLVVILGPTASGKTALSLALAENFRGEIVNCDSVAMYRELEIGTAKPTAEEQACAPHHLFDCVDPADYITAGEYARRAREVLEEIKARGHLSIVVGGTGLYLRALLEGLFPGPQRSEGLRERLRKRAESHGSGHLHKILYRLDRAAAKKIHANDTPKLIRAIEVCLASRKKMTDLWQQGRDPLRGFQVVRIGLDPDREALYDRINRRAQRMFETGLIEETRALQKKYGEDCRPLTSLSYKQAAQFLRGEFTREQAMQAAQQAHRNYAKRQMTWFRREPEITWLRGFGDDAKIQERAIEHTLPLIQLTRP
jgi:tRNA dimethylallyltransferase